MTADAMENAGLFCAFNGFRLGKALYEEIVGEFVKDAAGRGVTIPQEEIRRLLDREANLAELAAFKWQGDVVGRDFLERLFTQRYLPVKFELSANKQSWLRLLSNLHRDRKDAVVLPLEWEELSSETRGLLMDGVGFVGGNVARLMTSDQDHAVHLVERLNNWSQILSMFLDFPASLLERMPDERVRALQGQKAAVQAVLDMVAADPESSLYANVRDLMDDGRVTALQGSWGNRGFFIAQTLLAAERKELVRVPPPLKALFEDIVSRAD
jgi:hypothetical protein